MTAQSAPLFPVPSGIGSTVAATVSGTVPVSTATPAAANVLDGAATTNGSTIITVPAGRTWIGSVQLSGQFQAPASQAATAPVTTVTVQGTNATPASGSVVAQVTPATALQLATTTGQSVSQVTIPSVVAIAPAGNSVTLQLNVSAGTAAATAVGVLQ